MSPRTIRLAALAATAPLLSFLLIAAHSSGNMSRVAGTYTMTYRQRHPIVVPDAEGHVVMATEATGRNRSTGPAAFEDGAQVTIIESADMVQGNGSHEGYVVMTQNGGARINRWSGKLTTVVGPDHQPSTSFKGTWSTVSGPAGHGTYEGRITGRTRTRSSGPARSMSGRSRSAGRGPTWRPLFTTGRNRLHDYDTTSADGGCRRPAADRARETRSSRHAAAGGPHRVRSPFTARSNRARPGDAGRIPEGRGAHRGRRV